MKHHKSSVRLSDADEAAAMIGGIRTSSKAGKHVDVLAFRPIDRHK